MVNQLLSDHHARHAVKDQARNNLPTIRKREPEPSPVLLDLR